MKRVGLALGGGFVRGAAHIGVLKALEAEGVRPAVIAGTSAGSIVAALYAAGFSAGEMERIALALNLRDVLDDGPLLGLLNAWRVVAGILRRRLGGRAEPGAPLGLLPGGRLLRLLTSLFGDRKFDDLPLPLVVTATDIAGGRRVVFLPAGYARDEFARYSCVPVALAVRASCSVPGLLEPVRWDGSILVDGAVREAVPAEAVRLAGAEVVIAVDVGGGTETRHRVHDIADLLTRAWELALGEGKRKELERYADEVVTCALDDVPVWDFSRIPCCIRTGEQAARAALGEIREVLA